MPRRSKEFLKRSKAAKKGWRTRRKRYGPSGRKPKPAPPPTPPLPPGEGVTLEAGYDGRGNSFSILVSINPYNQDIKNDPDRLAALIEKLAQSGQFDESENNPNYDLSWVFFNSWRIVERGVHIKRGHAVLEGFARVAPGSL
jgi:hypothetical protein